MFSERANHRGGRSAYFHFASISGSQLHFEKYGKCCTMRRATRNVPSIGLPTAKSVLARTTLLPCPSRIYEVTSIKASTRSSSHVLFAREDSVPRINGSLDFSKCISPRGPCARDAHVTTGIQSRVDILIVSDVTGQG